MRVPGSRRSFARALEDASRAKHTSIDEHVFQLLNGLLLEEDDVLRVRELAQRLAQTRGARRGDLARQRERDEQECDRDRLRDHHAEQQCIQKAHGQAATAFSGSIDRIRTG